MRRDVYIENDSGGLSVIAAAAADAIIADQRQDDMRFVESHAALLLELYGDDSLPVRVVVDEELSADEQAQWLARATWRIDAPDGRLLIMGGFDPDVLGWWRDAGDPDSDGRGVAVIAATPGSWRVDLYAHAGSMNGREILYEAGEPLGASFRRSHPDRPFPLWLASALEFSGDEDPGHEDLWQDVAASVESGQLELDTESAGAVGFVVHLTPFTGEPPAPPDAGWFERDAGRRIPEVFPVGLPAHVPDPNLDHFLDRALRRERPAEPAPVASEVVEIIESWPGEPLAQLTGGPIRLDPADAFHLHWIAAFASDSPPAFELWVSEAGNWAPPDPRPEFGVTGKGGSTWAIGAPPNSGGWWLWWGARLAAQALGRVPDGATLDLAMAPRTWENDELDPEVGRALYSGTVEAGSWHVSEASPAVGAKVLTEALGFVRDIVEHGSIAVHGDDERLAFDSAAAVFSPEDGSLEWDGDLVRLTEPDERTLLLLAEPVFRTCFGSHWPCDPIDG